MRKKKQKPNWLINCNQKLKYYLKAIAWSVLGHIELIMNTQFLIDKTK